MKVYTSPQPGIISRSAIALGFFDGVHLGHQSVIKASVNYARANNVESGIVTFKDHPRTLTLAKQPMLLTSLEQRLARFSDLGVETALVLTFTPELCNLSAKDYVKNILKGSMGAKYISIGQNHHFGKDRQGDCVLLESMAKENMFTLHVSPILKIDEFDVSSTVIRQNLSLGHINIVNKLLGRNFAICGKVVSGQKRGRTIGFPTANLQINKFQSIPANGVYSGEVKIDKQAYQTVVTIGLRPTFENTNHLEPLIEAHILNFNGDIYDKDIELSFLDYIRAERKFDSVDALINQIKEDCHLVISAK